MIKKVMISTNKINYLILIFYYLLGIYVYKDFGLGIEEHFQRKLGFYWLNYILDFTSFENLKIVAFGKYEEIKILTPNLVDIKTHFYYGIIFDLFLAFIESFFNISGPNIFHFRHLITFTVFFISSIFFFKIISKRFNNYWVSIFGILIYLLTPKVFGSAFFDGKDLFFYSLLTINFYLFFNYLDKPNFKNLFIFAAFSAFSTSSRIFGLIIPLSLLILNILESLQKNTLKYIKSFFIFLLIYILILFIHWPFMWQLNFNSINFLELFKVRTEIKVFFQGEFYNSTNLPQSYIPKLIFFETPIFIILLFLLGALYKSRRFFLRVISIKENKKHIYTNDLWNNYKEKIDLFFLLSFIIVVMYYYSFNPNLWGGWRHFIFLNFFISYFSCYAIYVLQKYFKNKIIKTSINFILILFTFDLIYSLYKLHPYQSLYFNRLIDKNEYILYEIDNQSLSRMDAIEFIMKDAKELDIIKVGTAAFTPLEDARFMFNKKRYDKIDFVGTNFDKNTNYIFTNHFYEVDNSIDDKYHIPKVFKLYKELNIDGIRIYSIYKK